MLRIITAVFFAVSANGAVAQYCPEIKFARGASSGEVSGQVSDTLPLCFLFGSGEGQTARLQLFGSENACFTVAGVIDCQDDFSFRTQGRTYEVGVFQLFRRTAWEHFTLRLTIY